MEREKMIKQANITGKTIRKCDGETRKDIEEFISSGWDCCDVDCSRFASSSAAYTSYYSVLKKEQMYDKIKAMRRRDKLYLVKADLIKSE